MGKGPASLADAIRASVPDRVRRSLLWWEKLSPDVLAELEAVRQDFRHGRLPPNKSALARAIVEHLHARNLATVKTQGVISWLSEKG